MDNQTVTFIPMQNYTQNVTDEAALFTSVSEVAFTIFLCVLMASLAITGQGSVVFVIAKTENLRTPEYGIVLSHALADCCLTVVAAASFLPQLAIRNYFTSLCELFSPLTKAVGTGLQYHIAFLAWERYIFFCRPLRYHQIVREKTIAITVVVIYIITSVYFFALHNIVGSRHNTNLLICTIHPHRVIAGIIQVTVFITLPLIIIAAFVVPIWRASWKAQIAPALPQGAVLNQDGLPMKKAKAAVRIIGLVSGSHLVSTIPRLVIVIRGIMGYSQLHGQIDSALRLSFLVHVFLPPIFNTVINMYGRPLVQRGYINLWQKWKA